jgi:putative N6-adenine-specific DNA methylase
MSQPTSAVSAFATTGPGLEPLLRAELEALGYGGLKSGVSGVSFRTDRHGLERACLTLRTVHRVLWTLGGVDGSSADSLYRTTRELVRWSGLVPPDATFAVAATVRNNPALRDQRYVALVVKDAIVDALRDDRGTRPDIDVEDPDILVRVSLSGRQGIVSLDAGGKTSLHARGYRTDAGEAPLRETLAAALLMLSEWHPGEPLVDPMCGAGTLAIEAALLGVRRAPGLVARSHGRSYGFERWPGFRPDRLARLVAALEADQRPAEGLRILGSDVSSAAIRQSRENADRAGLDREALAFHRADALNWTPGSDTPPGLIVANPPYGARLGGPREALALYAAFGRHLREVARGWRVAILAPTPREAEALGIPHLRWFNLKNGELAIIACLGEVR